MSAPRITFLVSQLGYGGAEKQTWELIRRLQQQKGTLIRCICLSEMTEPYGDKLRKAGIELTILSRGSSFDLGRLLRLRRLLFAGDSDILHCIHYLASGYGYLARLGARRPHFLPSIRSTVVRHGRLKSWVYRRMFAACTTVIANSHAGAAFLSPNFRVEVDRIRIIENGLDIDQIDREAGRGGDLRDELNIAPDTLLVGFIGKDSPVKNVGRFLSVCARIERDDPSVHFVLVGWKLAEEDRERLGLDPARYHLLGTRDDVPRILRSLSLLIISSNSEGCPNVLIEASLLGTPAIAPDVGDCARIVDPVRNRSITPDQDPASYASLARNYLSDGLSETDAALLRSWVRDHYSLNTMIDSTLEVYEQLLSAANSSR